MGAAKQTWCGIDRVQRANPGGGEPGGRGSSSDVLGLEERPKAAAQAARGGARFEAGGVRLNVGPEPPFAFTRGAHPTPVMRGQRRLIGAAGLAADWSDDVAGADRCHDPFGNRIELIAAEPNEDRS